MISLPAADLDYASALARTALDRMQTHRVPPTPRNFELWYAAAASLNPALERALQSVFVDGGAWSDAVSADLHARFIDASPDAATVGDALEREIAAILRLATRAGQETRSYGEALDAVSGQMDRGLDGVRLKAIVGQLAASTRAMHARARCGKSGVSSPSKTSGNMPRNRASR